MDQEIFGITVLEWLKVLVVPITVSAAVPWLNWLQKKREQTVEDQRAQDEALQAYLDKMSELLIDKNLHGREGEYSPERVTARAQTLTVLRRLDAVHKRTVLQFLREARPINRHEYSPKDEPNVTYYAHYVGLEDADFSGSDLESARLISSSGEEPISLKGANLKNAKVTADVHQM